MQPRRIQPCGTATDTQPAAIALIPNADSIDHYIRGGKSVTKTKITSIQTRSWLVIKRIFNRKCACQNASLAICILFGLALIANTQSAGEGTWFWYSVYFNNGKHLYADLHLALQPIYVLETSAFMTLFGKGWIASKIPAVLHLIAYCLSLRILVAKSNLTDIHKAILLLCAFFVGISFEAYCFSDYHVLTDCFTLYSLVALLSFDSHSSIRRTLTLSTILGALSGLAFTTRVNDGAALFTATFLSIACLAPARKIASLALFTMSVGLTVLFIVGLTGDTVQDYARYSIFNAAQSKGGSDRVFTQPLRLPFNAAQWLIDGNLTQTTLPYCLGVGLIWGLSFGPLRRRLGKPGFLIAVAVAVLTVLQARRMDLFNTTINTNFCSVLLNAAAATIVILGFLIAFTVLAKFAFWLFQTKRPTKWNRREMLLLVPMSQLASGSMSSAGTHVGLYTPVAMLLILLPICSPIRLRNEWARDILFALAVILMLSTATSRFDDPYSWHAYREKPLSSFASRTVYKHPEYGPMIIDKDLLEMIQPVCQKIAESESNEELLSLPFPYANYFCSIAPWHGYVQTFFDTTSRQTILELIDTLQHSPPKWIFYQRQLKTLALHESVFNQGKPLAQRDLDRLLQKKIDDGTWQVVYTSNFGDCRDYDNKWLLIRTR